MLELGVTAPDFELPNQDGRLLRLSRLRGQKVIVFAFPKAGSPGCTAQACSFRDQFPVIRTMQAVVLGVSPDTPETLALWKETHDLPYDLLSDPDHTTLEAWGHGPEAIYGTKVPLVARSYWVLDEYGVLIDRQINVGPKESVEKAVRAVTRLSLAGV